MKTSIAIALLAAAALPAFAGDPAVWKFREGDVLTWELENHFKFRPWAPPPDGPPPVDATGMVPQGEKEPQVSSGYYDETYVLRVTVGPVDGEGHAELALKFTEGTAHARHDDTGIEVEWDSKKSKEKKPEEFGMVPYWTLLQAEFKVKVAPNGDWGGLEGPADYRQPAKSKVRPAKKKLTRPEQASEAMPMPSDVEFWLDMIFRTIPPTGVGPRFERRLTSAVEIGREFKGEFDSGRTIGKERTSLYHWEAFDRRIKMDRADADILQGLSGWWKDGENVKRILAWSRRDIDAWFNVKDGHMTQVEGKGRDDAMKMSPYARNQDFEIKLKSRTSAK